MLPKEVLKPAKAATKKPSEARSAEATSASRAAKPRAAAKRTTARPAARTAARPAAAAAPAKKPVGKVTHFFGKISVAVIDLSAELRQGDTISIEGSSTNIKQKVTSMQINNAPVQVAKAGQSIGLKVPDRVRDGDVVFKLAD